MAALGLRAPRRKRHESLSSWRIRDRVGLAMCWLAGLTLCAIAGAIVLYMAVRGVQYLRPELLLSKPEATMDQSRSGGFLDPIVGTLLLTVIGIAIATPLGVCTAVWMVEYGRPRWLARLVESGIEVVAGTPDIVIAIFGLALFQQGIFSWLSFTSADGAVFGRSFLTAGAAMSLIALPMVFGSTREALEAMPRQLREASYALGKTQAATIRRVLVPAARPSISSGAVLGMGRIVGDTAVVVVLLGATLRIDPSGSLPGVDVLRGTGGTLTSYVYNNSPAGEGNAPEKAYAAAFVLLIIVMALNGAVELISRRAGGSVLAQGRT